MLVLESQNKTIFTNFCPTTNHCKPNRKSILNVNVLNEENLSEADKKHHLNFNFRLNSKRDIPPVSATLRSYVLPSYENTALWARQWVKKCFSNYCKWVCWSPNLPVSVWFVIKHILPCFEERVLVLSQVDRHLGNRRQVMSRDELGCLLPVGQVRNIYM